MEVSHTVLAQRMAVSTVPHEVQELLFLAAGLTVPTAKTEMRMTGDTVRVQRPMALPAGWVAFCTNTFLVKVALRALGEAAPSQQDMGRPTGHAVVRALPCTPEARRVASFTPSSALQVKVSSALGHTLAREDM